MRMTIIHDSSKCTGCRTCEMICSLRHTGTCNPVRSRMRIIHNKKEAIMRVKRCHFCTNPPCVEACPVDALKRDEISGIITVDRDLCIGCMECVQSCLLDGIWMDPVKEEIISCDLCGGKPACVEFCETEALEYARIDRTGWKREYARSMSSGEPIVIS